MLNDVATSDPAANERRTLMFDIEPFDPLAPTRDRLFGDYELIEQIAQGGMGLVYKARQISLNRTVALKIIRTGQLASPADVQRFHIEAEAAAHLEHPRLVPIFEVGELLGIHYFSMKLVEGGNLAQHMERYIRDPQAGARLIAAAARGIHYAHERGVLHRDLKPANILVDRDGRPHVTDFGVSKRVDLQFVDGSGFVASGNVENTLSGGVVGTPSYMAPEQAAGKPDALTTAVDVYSLGAILYEMLTGRPPFKEQTHMATLRRVLDERPAPPRSLNPRADRELEAICLKCLEREPHDRYHTADELAEDLDRWLANKPIRARTVNTWLRLAKWAKRHPNTAVLAVLFFVVTAAGMAGIVWQTRSTERERERADATKREEELHRQRADEARALVELGQYADSLGLVRELWQTGRLQEARDILAACPAAQRGWEWNHLSLLCDNDVRRLAVSVGSLTAMTVQPEGRFLALGSQDGSITLVPLDASDKPWKLTGHAAAITALAYSAGGSQLVSASTDRTVRLWNLATRSCTSVFTGYSGVPAALATSPDGRRLAVGLDSAGSGPGPKGLLYVYDVDTLARGVAEVMDGSFTALAFDRAGAILTAVVGGDRLWRWRLPPEGDPRLDAGSMQSLPGGTTAVALAGDGDRCALATADGSVSLMMLPPDSRSNGASRSLVKVTSRVVGLDFSPDDRTIAVATADGPLHVFETAAGKMILTLPPPGSKFGGMGFSTSGGLLAAVTTAGEVTIANVGRRQEAAVSEKLPASVLAFGNAAESGRIPLLLDNGELVECDAGSLQRSGLPLKLTDAATAACVCPCGTKGLLATGAGKLCRFELGGGTQLWSVPAGQSRVQRIACAPDGTVAAAGCADGSISLWSMASGVAKGVLKGHSESILAMAFHPKLPMLASADASGAIRVWFLDSSLRPLTLRGHQGLVTALAYNHDGSRLASAGADQTIRLWIAGDGTPVATLRGHTDCVSALIFSPGGDRLFSGGWDQSVRVWDPESGLELLTLRADHGKIQGLLFEANQARLLTSGSDQVIRAWAGR